MERILERENRCLEYLTRANDLMEELIRKVEKEEPCMEIVTKIITAQDCLKKANREILTNYFSSSVTCILQEGDRDRSIPEMVEILGRILN